MFPNEWVAQVLVKLGEQFKNSSTVLFSEKRPLTQFFFHLIGFFVKRKRIKVIIVSIAHNKKWPLECFLKIY